MTSPYLIGAELQSFFGGPSPFLMASEGFLVGIGLATAGLVALLAGSVIAIVNPYGGIVMFTGSVMGSAGITVMSFGAGAAGLLFTVDYGALVAFVASTIAVVGLLHHRAAVRDLRIVAQEELE